LNQLLAEMDGFDSSEGVIIMAATNTPEVLDAALLRAGRFDRQVLVDRPDLKDRVEILKVHARKIKMAEDVNLGACRTGPAIDGARAGAVAVSETTPTPTGSQPLRPLGRQSPVLPG